MWAKPLFWFDRESVGRWTCDDQLLFNKKVLDYSSSSRCNQDQAVSTKIRFQTSSNENISCPYLDIHHAVQIIGMKVCRNGFAYLDNFPKTMILKVVSQLIFGR